jgi:gamma-glutamyl phosphate reductase
MCGPNPRPIRKSVLNVEDYIDNSDGRNYDITSAMVFNKSEAFTTVSKFGSPLNVGTHKMKLIANGGPVAVESITFELIKKHELTPLHFATEP